MPAEKKKNIPKQAPVKKTPENKSKPLVEATVFGLKRKYAIPAAIFMLCFLLYGNTIPNGYAEDDDIYAKGNTIIKAGFSQIGLVFSKGSLYGFDKTNESQYRPVPMLNFMVETSIFGLNPHVSHFFNIFFYAITVILFYFLLQKILPKYNQAIIISATLLFLFHPIHTEVVANIKSRDEILGLLFGLLSFYYIMRYSEKNKMSYYVISLAAFFVSIFSKENCLTFIVVIPMLLYFFTPMKIKDIIVKTLPFVGLVLVCFFIRSKVLTNMTFGGPIPVMNNGLMATNNQADRLATGFVILGKYIYMCFVPYPLSWDYSYPQIPIVSFGNIKAILSILTCAALVGYAVWGIKKKSVYAFAIFFFFATIILSSNTIVKIASTFSERFLFTPSLAFCLVLPLLTTKAMRLIPLQPAWKNKGLYIPLACVLAVYTFIVIPRNMDWANNYTLFLSGVTSSPNSGRTHGALASMYMDSAQHNDNPAYKQKKYALAAQEFKRVTQLFTMDPDGYYNLGVCYYGEGKEDSAAIAYKEALRVKPDYSGASNNLGVIYFNKGKYSEAIPYFLMSFKGDTNNMDALMNIGASYQNQKNYAMAFHYDSLVLKKDPNSPLVRKNLSIIFNDLGMQEVSNNNLEKAYEQFHTALTFDTNSSNVLGNIGVVYQKQGNYPMAIKYYQKALSKDPKNEVFERNLETLTKGNK